MILLIKQPKQIRRKSEILNIIKFLDQLASFLWDCNETIVVAIQLLRFIRIREKYDYRMEKNYNFLIVLIRNWKQVFRMYFHILEKWQEILWKTENFYNFETIHNVTTTVLKMSIFDKKVACCCVSLKIVHFLLSYSLISMSVNRWLISCEKSFWKQSFAKHSAIQMMCCLCQIVTTRIFSFFNNFTRNRNSFLCFPTTILCLICFNKPYYESLMKG